MSDSLQPSQVALAPLPLEAAGEAVAGVRWPAQLSRVDSRLMRRFKNGWLYLQESLASLPPLVLVSSPQRNREIVSHLEDGAWKVGVEQLAAALLLARGYPDETLTISYREAATALLAVRGLVPIWDDDVYERHQSALRLLDYMVDVDGDSRPARKPRPKEGGAGAKLRAKSRFTEDYHA